VSDRVWSWIAAVYLVLCVLLGGASAAGAAANGLLQLVGGLLIILLAWGWGGGTAWPRGFRSLALIVGAYAAWNLLTLVPLPASLWEALPGRDSAAQALRALGAEPGAMPASLSPRRTIASLLWLIPPLAAFFLLLRLPSAERRRVGAAVIAAAVVSLVLGAFQVMGGEGSPLRFYTITNPDASVGFFANKNHLATLLLCSLPIAGALAGRAASRSGRTRRHSATMIYGSIVFFILIGLALSRSMAGYGLILPAGAASLIIYWRESRGEVPRRAWIGLGALMAAFVAFAAVGPISSEALSSKLTTDPSSRRVMTARTIDAAGDYFPAGSGLGSFQQVYRTKEDPAMAVRQFANHAHNDYAEVALELGLPGILLVLAFFLWWGRRSLAAWSGDFSGAGLARAGSVLVGVVLLHSIVDYPLRTSAIAALFAAGCAFLLQPPLAEAKPSRRRQEGEAGERGARHLQAD
jgi:O-antigen ligase